MFRGGVSRAPLRNPRRCARAAATPCECSRRNLRRLAATGSRLWARGHLCCLFTRLGALLSWPAAPRHLDDHLWHRRFPAPCRRHREPADGHDAAIRAAASRRAGEHRPSGRSVHQRAALLLAAGASAPYGRDRVAADLARSGLVVNAPPMLDAAVAAILMREGGAIDQITSADCRDLLDRH